MKIIASLLLLCATLPIGAALAPPCYQQMQTNFFDQALVAEALNIYRVDKQLWHPIYRDLRRESFQIPALVQSLAKSKSPNPLSPVFRPLEAFEVLQQALALTFSTVMLRYRSLNYAINQSTADGAFKYMWQKHLFNLQRCAQTGR